MASPLVEFGKIAQRLARNPLGIIALFIVLVYGIAALVLGYSSENLEPKERAPIVWFLVIFPVVVLAVFYRLVSHHHTKLYAPQDFHDKDGFFRTLTPTEKKERLNADVEALELEAKEMGGKKAATTSSEETETPEPISTRHAYVMAEELALREIEGEFGVQIHRQVAIGSDHGVDGVYIDNGKPTAVEVKFTRGRLIRQMVREVMQRFKKIAYSTIPLPDFFLAVVSDGMTHEQMKLCDKEIVELLGSSSFPIIYRIYNLEDLKEKYGLAETTT